MGYKGVLTVWVIRAMGQQGLDCNDLVSEAGGGGGGHA